MDVQITESLRHNLTVTDSSYSLTMLAGPAGPTGPAGPNAITSSTSSDGTVNLSVNSLTAGTVSATGNISGSAGDFTTLTVGSSDQFSVSSAGDVGTSGNVTLSDGDVVATVGDITALAGTVLAPDILASADLGYSSGGTETQENSITSGVTLNAPSGVITLLSSHTYLSPFVGSTPANPSINFTLTNTDIGANDVVVVSLQDGDDSLSVSVTNTTTGTCDISIRNGGTSNVTPVSPVKVNFAIIKVATS